MYLLRLLACLALLAQAQLASTSKALSQTSTIMALVAESGCDRVVGLLG
jgi:hypothetical protein